MNIVNMNYAKVKASYETFTNFVCWIFLISLRLRSINNFVVKNNFSEPWNPQ